MQAVIILVKCHIDVERCCCGLRGKVSKLGFGHTLAVKLNFGSVQRQIFKHLNIKFLKYYIKHKIFKHLNIKIF